MSATLEVIKDECGQQTVSKESSQKCGEREKRDQDDRVMLRGLDFVKN